MTAALAIKTRKATAEIEEKFAAALTTLAESAVKAVAKAVVKPDTQKFAAPIHGSMLRKDSSTEGQDATTDDAAIIAAIVASIDWPVLTRAAIASSAFLEAVAVDADTKIAAQLGIAASKARAGLGNAVGARVTALAALLIDASKDMLQQMLEGAFGVGGTVEKIGAAIRRAYVFSKNRAATIALSETATANGIGSVSAIQAGGAMKEWLTAQDERTCPVCMGNEDAGLIEVEAMFPSGHLAPGAHPNCRCVVRPVIVS